MPKSKEIVEKPSEYSYKAQEVLVMPNYEIYGETTVATGGPLPGVKVAATNLAGADVLVAGVAGTQNPSDANGQFRVTVNVKAGGMVRLKFTPPGNQYVLRGGTDIVIKVNSAIDLGTLIYSQATSGITGKVLRQVWRNGLIPVPDEPYANVEVQLLDKDTTLLESATTNTLGEFTFLPRQTGLLFLRFPPRVPINSEVLTLRDPANAEKRIYLQPNVPLPFGTVHYDFALAEVVGRVSDGLAGLPNILITLIERIAGSMTPTARAPMRTDAAGNYRFPNVYPGLVEVVVPRQFRDARGVWELSNPTVDTQSFHIRSNDAQQFDVTYHLEAHIVERRLTDLLTGKPIAGRLVEVRDITGGEVVMRKVTGSDGRVLFNLQHGGTFQVWTYREGNLDPESKETNVGVHSRNYRDVQATGSSDGTASGRGASDEFADTITDLSRYPILTEEVSFPGTSGQGTSAAPSGGAAIGQVVESALRDVLGWKPRTDDTKGFLGALNQSFELKEVEGHTEWKWTPRTYAVQTDLAGGITGAQASIYTRAKDAIDKATSLLEGLKALRLDADPEDTEALKAVIKSHMTELTNELGISGGPRVARVEQLFALLLGADETVTEPDRVSGDLGNLRKELGLETTMGPNLINTVEDEQIATNYRILTDYATGIRQTWINNRDFFTRTTRSIPFLGTQLVLLSRTLEVVAESVGEVRSTMDSVFIGPSERQTLEIEFPPQYPDSGFLSTRLINQVDPNTLLNSRQINSKRMFVEELLNWVERFASTEGPGLVQNGGKYAIQTSFLPIVVTLRNHVLGAIRPANIDDLPRGYRTARVQRTLQELAAQLHELAVLASPLQHDIPSQQ
jgi:hypothetical protein